MAELDRELAALRTSTADTEPMTALSPAAARERVALGDALCSDGPPVAVTEVHDLAARLRIYEGEDPPVATMLYAHGGGWVTGDLEYSDEFCRYLAADARVRVVSVDYRLAPEHPYPQPLLDVAEAWSWVVERYPEPLAAGGDSAGGNLVAALSQRLAASDGQRPRFQLLLYPVLGAPETTASYRRMGSAFPIGAAEMRWFFDHYAAAETVAAEPTDLVPLAATDVAGLPPTLVVLAGHDPLHDEGLEYAERLQYAGVPVDLVEHSSLCHGFLRFTAVSAAARSARAATVAAVADYALRVAPDRINR